MAWATALLLAVAACDKEAPHVSADPSTTTQTASPSASATAPESPVVVPTPTSKPAPDEPEKALTQEQRARARAYQKALEKGRLLAKRKQYPAAIAALDEALVHVADDPRALCERGYVKLLSNDLEGAKRDLDGAKGRISDKQLGSEVWFNLGLVEERRGNPEEARLCFARAFELKPTASARNKLSGKTLCPIRIDRTPSAAPVIYAGWLGAWKALGAAYERDYMVVDTERPVDDSTARTAFHVDSCVGACVAKVGDFGEINFHLVFPNGDGTLSVVVGIAKGGASRCSAGPGVMVAPGAADQPVHLVVAVEEPEPFVSCGGVGTPDEMCQIGCGDGTWTQRDLFFDRATRRRLLSLEQTGPQGQAEHQPVEVVGGADGVTLSASACDTRVPFKRP